MSFDVVHDSTRNTPRWPPESAGLSTPEADPSAAR
jgi:hypothetical protein